MHYFHSFCPALQLLKMEKTKGEQSQLNKPINVCVDKTPKLSDLSHTHILCCNRWTEIKGHKVELTHGFTVQQIYRAKKNTTLESTDRRTIYLKDIYNHGGRISCKTTLKETRQIQCFNYTFEMTLNTPAEQIFV
ncbi:hypothetical protein ATANTOWER_032841 [Ataeniobius toweri]|uniref:Uncharacterized protein n=1 Tax=Ataeniobius toweri TaxID=208326 RepID=A0ABU7B6B7_9TELE|nr:hypothetical protein [Ataeniobius toweri]